MLLRHFDDNQVFTLTTGLASRTYNSITQARSEGNNARVWGGMHYPSTVAISDAEGEAIANYVDLNAMQRVKRSAKNFDQPAGFMDPRRAMLGVRLNLGR